MKSQNKNLERLKNTRKKNKWKLVICVMFAPNSCLSNLIHNVIDKVKPNSTLNSSMSEYSTIDSPALQRKLTDVFTSKTLSIHIVSVVTANLTEDQVLTVATIFARTQVQQFVKLCATLQRKCSLKTPNNILKPDCKNASMNPKGFHNVWKSN